MIKVKSIVEIITECDRKDMSKEHSLLSDFLEELKVHHVFNPKADIFKSIYNKIVAYVFKV